MKTFKILFAAVIIAGFATSAIAQDDPSITATANVVQEISIDGTTDENNLVFGQVTAGNNKAIDVDGDVVLGIASGEEQTGWFRLNKAANTEVQIDLTLPENLVSDGNDLPIFFDEEQFGQIINGENTLSFIPTNGVLVSQTNSAGLFAAETYDIRIGGRVEPETDQAPGSYEGTITLQFEYN